MKKQLVALLSIIGLAASGVPARAQDKDTDEQAKTKKEQQIKHDKQAAEKKADRKDKWAKSQKESSAAKNEAAIKLDKAAAEKKAAKADAASKDAAKTKTDQKQ
jgi:hypothetical protein